MLATRTISATKLSLTQGSFPENTSVYPESYKKQ